MRKNDPSSEREREFGFSKKERAARSVVSFKHRKKEIHDLLDPSKALRREGKSCLPQINTKRICWKWVFSDRNKVTETKLITVFFKHQG